MKLPYTIFNVNRTARDLLELGAVDFRPEQPFTFTSGRVSPIYVDVRRLISVPAVRVRLAAIATSFIAREIGYAGFNVIAGGETAGIPIATLIADRMDKTLC